MYFLEIENFNGSPLRTEIQSWSSGPGNPPAGGGGTGAVASKIKDIQVTRSVDKHSPEFLSRAAKGRAFPKVVITTVYESGKGGFTVTMKDVYVSSYQVSDPRGGPLTETMSFNFGEIELKYEAPVEKP